MASRALTGARPCEQGRIGMFHGWTPIFPFPLEGVSKVFPFRGPIMSAMILPPAQGGGIEDAPTTANTHVDGLADGGTASARRHQSGRKSGGRFSGQRGGASGRMSAASPLNENGICVYCPGFCVKRRTRSRMVLCGKWRYINLIARSHSRNIFLTRFISQSRIRPSNRIQIITS